MRIARFDAFDTTVEMSSVIGNVDGLCSLWIMLMDTACSVTSVRAVVTSYYSVAQAVSPSNAC